MIEKPLSEAFLERLVGGQVDLVESGQEALEPEDSSDPDDTSLSPTPLDRTELLTLVQQAKHLAKRYRELTGRPLGITGEIAESEVVRLLGLELAPVRTAGYDVIRHLPDGNEYRLQVKGRVIHSTKLVGRMGSIDITKDWDAVLLVLLDQNYDAFKIFEAARAPVIKAITDPGSKARNERGALSVPLFCSAKLGRQVWPPTE